MRSVLRFKPLPLLFFFALGVGGAGCSSSAGVNMQGEEGGTGSGTDGGGKDSASKTDGGDADGSPIDTGTSDVTSPSDGAADSASPTDSSGSDTGGSDTATGVSAPAYLLLTNQGGAGNTSSSTQELAWQPATGKNPIAHYKIYRNGTSIATTTSLTYTDGTATNSNVIASYAPATIYAYAVSAVDSKGNEGPKATPSFYMYRDGVAYNGQGSYSYGLTSLDWQDTSGAPPSGKYDVEEVIPAAGGGFQPYTAPTMAPTWAGEVGAFNYFTIDVKFTSLSNEIHLSMLSRPGGAAPSSGDVYGWSGATLLDSTGHSAYGTPVLNGWATFKVPFSDLGLGISTFEGYISGTTLTMTKLVSGPGPDGAAYILGTGVAAGTYISKQPPKGGPFTLNASMTVGSASAPVTLTSQRTNLYKFDVYQPSLATGTTLYLDNMGWTTE